MMFDVNLTDGKSHQVSLYLDDWDGSNTRQEKIQIVNATTGAVLSTQTVSAFSAGEYLTWNVSGHVQIIVTNVSATGNAVVSGVFFG